MDRDTYLIIDPFEQDLNVLLVLLDIAKFGVSIEFLYLCHFTRVLFRV
jgi:hypothetical protein